MRQQSFHPVCQKCNLRVYMKSVRGVDIRSDINWRETFLNIGGKISTCFLKLHSTCPKEHFELKKLFLKVLFFFKLFGTLNEHLLCLARKFSVRQGSQNWKLQSSSHKIKRKIKLLKNLFFFSKFSELWTNIYRAWRKSFGQGYQKSKLYSMSLEYHFEVKKKFLKF